MVTRAIYPTHIPKHGRVNSTLLQKSEAEGRSWKRLWGHPSGFVTPCA
jgi:hypothetical protein